MPVMLLGLIRWMCFISQNNSSLIRAQSPHGSANGSTKKEKPAILDLYIPPPPPVPYTPRWAVAIHLPYFAFHLSCKGYVEASAWSRRQEAARITSSRERPNAILQWGSQSPPVNLYHISCSRPTVGRTPSPPAEHSVLLVFCPLCFQLSHHVLTQRLLPPPSLGRWQSVVKFTENGGEWIVACIPVIINSLE